MNEGWYHKLQEKYEPWLDEYGLICKIDQKDHSLSGGDTVHNTMSRVFCQALVNGVSEELKKEYNYYCSLLNPKPGIWIRHPRPNHWWSEPDKLSRDAMIPIVCALIAMRDTKRANELLIEHKKRYRLWAQGSGRIRKTGKPNFWKDPTMFEFNALLDRACRNQSRLLVLGDFEMYLGVLNRKYISVDKDIRNFALTLLASAYSPTTMGNIARKTVNKKELIQMCIFWWKIRPGEPGPIADEIIYAIKKVL